MDWVLDVVRGDVKPEVVSFTATGVPNSPNALRNPPIGTNEYECVRRGMTKGKFTNPKLSPWTNCKEFGGLNRRIPRGSGDE